MSKHNCPKCGDVVSPRGHARGVPRYFCARCEWHGTATVQTDRSGRFGASLESLISGNLSKRRAARYVITSAQNATPVYRPFFESLLRYCKVQGAQLLVIPYRYKNPTSMWSRRGEDDEWWAPELAPYLIDRRVNLSPHIMLLGDIKTQPTAARPLEGFETISGGLSAIIGHPRLELRAIPTPQHKLPKLLVSTGSVTKPNYIPSKAGKRGEFHHTHAALVVEVAPSGKFFLRQLNATRNGWFIDLDREYTPQGVRKTQAAGLVMGDTHVDFADPGAVAATFEGPGSIVGLLRPKVLVWHDVLDCYSRTPHHNGEPVVNHVKHKTGRSNVEAEVDRAFAFVDRYTPKDAINVFVHSNHNHMLARWIKSTDPRLDPENCVFWARTFAAMCEGASMTSTGVAVPDPFAYWAGQKLRCRDRSVFLGPQDSYRVRNVEVGYHGHDGPNGARGSLRQFTRVGERVVIGHSHTPGIIEGAYQVGTTSVLAQDYVRGPSARLHGHCVIYANGKRSLLLIIDREWRLC